MTVLVEVELRACRPCLEKLGWRKYLRRRSHFRKIAEAWCCKLCGRPVVVLDAPEPNGYL